MENLKAELVVELKFDANAVLVPIKVAAQQANEIVTFAANAIAGASLTQAPQPNQ
jgi:hypothetical protein